MTHVATVIASVDNLFLIPGNKAEITYDEEAPQRKRVDSIIRIIPFLQSRLHFFITIAFILYSH